MLRRVAVVLTLVVVATLASGMQSVHADGPADNASCVALFLATLPPGTRDDIVKFYQAQAQSLGVPFGVLVSWKAHDIAPACP